VKGYHVLLVFLPLALERVTTAIVSRKFTDHHKSQSHKIDVFARKVATTHHPVTVPLQGTCLRSRRVVALHRDASVIIWSTAH